MPEAFARRLEEGIYQIVAFLPRLAAVLGIVLGEFIEDVVLASAGGVRGECSLARAAKVAVVVLTVFMALEQLEIAEDIVPVLFVAVVGAASLGAAIAFGLGARDLAGEIARDWYERGRRVTHPARPEEAPPPEPPEPTAPPSPRVRPDDARS